MNIFDLCASHKPPLPAGWTLIDEPQGMGARYERADGLRVISSTLRLGSSTWYHVSAAREGGATDSDLVEVRSLFIPGGVPVVKGMLPGAPRANPNVVHLWSTGVPGKLPPFGDLVSTGETG